MGKGRFPPWPRGTPAVFFQQRLFQAAAVDADADGDAPVPAQASATARTFSAEPMLPGLMRTLSAPASMASRARR